MGEKSHSSDRERLVNMSLRLPASVHTNVSVASARAGQSMNAWIVDIVREAGIIASAQALRDEMDHWFIDHDGSVTEEQLRATLRLALLASGIRPIKDSSIREMRERLDVLVDPDRP